MRQVKVGIVGLGNVGSGTLAILAENADQIALKLGFRLQGRRGLQPLGRIERRCRKRSARCSGRPTGARW